MNSNNEVCCILFVVATLWTSLGSVVVVGQPAPNGPPGAPPIMLALPKVKNNFANNNNNTGGPGGGGMDWLGLHQKICSLSESIVPGISKRFEECNKMSKFFQLEQLFRKCRQMRTSSDNYLEIMRSECKLEACHESVLKSDEYKRVMAELETMSNELRHAKSLERYKCISTALGIPQ